MSTDKQTTQTESSSSTGSKRRKYAIIGALLLVAILGAVLLSGALAEDDSEPTPQPEEPTEEPTDTETDTSTPTETPTEDPTTDTPDRETLSGLVDIKPNGADGGAYVQYTANDTLTTSNARIVINGTENVDGTYPASQFLENDSFTNEKLYLTEDTLGSSYELFNDVEITFQYKLNGEWVDITVATFPKQ